MSKEQFEREKLYQASMNFFRGMLAKEIITAEQFAVINEKMVEKYNPPLSVLITKTA